MSDFDWEQQLFQAVKELAPKIVAASNRPWIKGHEIREQIIHSKDPRITSLTKNVEGHVAFLGIPQAINQCVLDGTLVVNSVTTVPLSLPEKGEQDGNK